MSRPADGPLVLSPGTAHQDKKVRHEGDGGMEDVPMGGGGLGAGAEEVAISVNELNYKYVQYSENVFAGHGEHAGGKGLWNLNVDIPKGARVLVIGGNGAGKSTLLSLIGGKKMVRPPDAVTVFGRSAFNDTTLGRDVMYLGDWWKNDFFMDIPVREVVKEHVGNPRFERLCKFLDVDLDWKVARISDGQRRRCQLLANLATPKSVYLMDEVTTDLDVVGRDCLMRMLRLESEERGVTIVYATHIFDNLEGWPTHVLYLRKGQLAFFGRMQDLKEYHELRAQGHLQPLYAMVKRWLYRELEEEGRLTEFGLGEGGLPSPSPSCPSSGLPTAPSGSAPGASPSPFAPSPFAPVSGSGSGGVSMNGGTCGGGGDAPMPMES
uniref:ABC transporter domain-containing protein n=1 Tax=Chromera velia CCMP2878 TaxID=1169474 RepID=A0A0G4FKC2_9ALVE|eukprot:Cvel_17483.t1-p1 / transcript=Cvel_17483.t1 / gene=Cvel_17483 / organism=Chromera_velia_CCMP2878 / gene_product=ABC transporter I family member 20, putative / transcript_product=ABC transporter I family member 20, putative / location=Cvel_scaffold1399:3087-8720(-) / protein_length=378 / sequence_SO=supercontig / SO=protein_coding / is_pseudo=false